MIIFCIRIVLYTQSVTMCAMAFLLKLDGKHKSSTHDPTPPPPPFLPNSSFSISPSCKHLLADDLRVSNHAEKHETAVSLEERERERVKEHDRETGGKKEESEENKQKALMRRKNETGKNGMS